MAEMLSAFDSEARKQRPHKYGIYSDVLWSNLCAGEAARLDADYWVNKNEYQSNNCNNFP